MRSSTQQRFQHPRRRLGIRRQNEHIGIPAFKPRSFHCGKGEHVLAFSLGNQPADFRHRAPHAAPGAAEMAIAVPYPAALHVLAPGILQRSEGGSGGLDDRIVAAAGNGHALCENPQQEKIHALLREGVNRRFEAAYHSDGLVGIVQLAGQHNQGLQFFLHTGDVHAGQRGVRHAAKNRPPDDA